MARVCDICGKGTITGNNVPRSGKAKKKGGIGEHIGVKTRRLFRPNLVKVRTEENGTVKTVKLCMRCLKAGKVVKKV